ncbi:MAG: hypothetical protein ACRD0K_03890 [Egibacteraceae bacterium]
MNLLEGDDHVVGFRPERLLPKEVAVPGTDDLELDLYVQRVEHLGPERRVVGTVDGITEKTRVIAVLPSTVTTPIHEGQAQPFTVATEDLRFFTKSGHRIEPHHV